MGGKAIKHDLNWELAAGIERPSKEEKEAAIILLPCSLPLRTCSPLYPVPFRRETLISLMGSALNYAAGRGEGGDCAHPPSATVQVAQGIFSSHFRQLFLHPMLQRCANRCFEKNDKTAVSNTLIPIPRERAFVSKAKKE